MSHSLSVGDSRLQDLVCHHVQPRELKWRHYFDRATLATQPVPVAKSAQTVRPFQKALLHGKLSRNAAILLHVFTTAVS